MLVESRMRMLRRLSKGKEIATPMILDLSEKVAIGSDRHKF